MTDGSNKFICNSTAEFLIFTAQASEQQAIADEELRSQLAGIEKAKS